MNKRLLGGIAAAGIIGGGVYGFAATLGVTSDSVSAGNSGVFASCDETVQVDYTVAWGGTQYEIDDVVVSDIDATACSGDAISVTLVGGISPVTLDAGTVDATSETFDASDDNVAAADVNDVHVAIGG
jgi:hypothetical protein